MPQLATYGENRVNSDFKRFTKQDIKKYSLNQNTSKIICINADLVLTRIK